MRAPHRYGMGRSADGDAGGVADLQTDVMRFMAILALCLVVIFALVQSIPRPAPEQPVTQTAPPDPVPDEAPVAEPVIEPAPVVAPQPPVAEVVVVTRSDPQPAPPPPVTPEPIPSAPIDPAPAPPQPEREGFTLQFESDNALTLLVARNAVGLYALDDDTTLRMGLNRGRVTFWPASLPNAFHEMDPATVPANVTRALRLTRGTGAPVTWGVTLPANMQRELDALVNGNTGGALYIAGDGAIRLER